MQHGQHTDRYMYARTLHGPDQICTDSARIRTDVHGRTDAARTLHGYFMVPGFYPSRRCWRLEIENRVKFVVTTRRHGTVDVRAHNGSRPPVFCFSYATGSPAGLLITLGDHRACQCDSTRATRKKNRYHHHRRQ